MAVKQKITIRLTISFLIIYTLATTVGSIFLVTWGSTNWYKETLVFMLTWPVKWDELIIESFVWLFVNIGFWTVIVYLISLVTETFTWKLFSKIAKVLNVSK
jgi:hypothetical protein